MKVRNNFLQRLAGSLWDSDTPTIGKGDWTIIYSAAEYVSSVWYRTKNSKSSTYTSNHPLRTTTGCLLPTPTKYLPLLAGKAPYHIRKDFHVTA